MKEKIWCRGKMWETNEYNKRLSRENQIDEKYDKMTKKLEQKQEKEISEVWSK